MTKVLALYSGTVYLVSCEAAMALGKRPSTMSAPMLARLFRTDAATASLPTNLRRRR